MIEYMFKKLLLPFTLAIILSFAKLTAQQVAIPRIDQMPDRPSPYLMRDWKQTARGYDSLVLNFNLTGTYLPLVWLNTSTVNYPSHNSFGLNTVVGRYPEGVTLNQTALGGDSVLSEPPHKQGGPTLEIGRQSRVGTTTKLA